MKTSRHVVSDSHDRVLSRCVSLRRFFQKSGRISASTAFDPQKHDPVSFSAAQARKPAPKNSGDYASVSSVSSYANLIFSSNFTLSSGTTDGSLAPSSLFNHKPCEESKTSAFSAQLKKRYRDISALEMKILADSDEPQDESRLVIKGGPSVGTEEAEMVRWKKATDDHKTYASLFLCLTYTGS